MQQDANERGLHPPQVEIISSMFLNMLDDRGVAFAFHNIPFASASCNYAKYKTCSVSFVYHLAEMLN